MEAAQLMIDSPFLFKYSTLMISESVSSLALFAALPHNIPIVLEYIALAIMDEYDFYCNP
jgi:hypothetical protein